MIRYILKRIVLLIPVLLIVSFMVFTLMDLAPGDIMSGMDLSNMSQEEVAELRSHLGLDLPLVVRYGKYMLRLVQGDLGFGDFTGHSVWAVYIDRLPNTLALAAVTIVVGVSIALPLGIFAARRAGKVVDTLTTAFTMIGMSMPIFWLSILAMLLFVYVLGWFPAAGFNDGFRSLILPGVCGAMGLLAACTRQTRSSMLEVLRADFLRTARAKGVPEKVVIRKHALGNALIPIVTTVGMSIAMAVSGTAIIETVFAWPGVGRFLVEAVASRDVTTTTGVVILTSTLYVLILLLVDLAYAFIDPRIKAQYSDRGRKKKSSAQADPVNAAAAVMNDALPADTDALKDGAAAAEAQLDSFSEDGKAPPAQADRESAQAEKSAIAAAASGIESFVTVTDFDSVLEDDGAGENGETVARKHKKRSRGSEVMRHLLRNPGAIAGMSIIAIMIILFIVSQFIPFNLVTDANVSYRFSPPSARFPFGTDNMGRNLFIRTIYATRFSLPIGFGATLVASLIGIMLGSLAAFYEGSILEEVIMRLCDSLASIPGLLMGMVIITSLGRSLASLILAVGIAAIPIFVRISRASVLTIKGNEFVEASKALGLSEFRILYTKVLPNGLAPIIITFTATLGAAILISAGLSFLGFGVPVPNPEWGSLVSSGRDNIRNAPWLTTIPGLFIMITVMAFNMLGDGLRDAFDPKLKK